jgi:hypothetical protein
MNHARMLNMKWNCWFILVGVFVVFGCAGKPTTPEELHFKCNPPVMPYHLVSDAEAYGREKVSWFAYDLDQDGRLEYFIADMHGAHTVSFLLIDDRGGTILLGRCDKSEDTPASQPSGARSVASQASTRADTGPADEPKEWASETGSFCCDQLLILNSKHEGYYDILAIYTSIGDHPVQKWELWVHHDGYYTGCDWYGGMVFTPEGFRLDTPDYECWNGPDDVEPFSIRAYWTDDQILFLNRSPVLKPVPTPAHYDFPKSSRSLGGIMAPLPVSEEAAHKGK